MLISNATMRALDGIAAREEQVARAFEPQAAPTIDPLSVSAPPDTYFVTRDARGRLLFGNNGAFSLRGGVLSDAQGRPLLGYAAPNAPLTALQIDPVDESLGLARTAQIQSDGTLTYERMTVDPRTGARELQRIAVGRIALARFAAGTRLQPVDAAHAAAPAGILPHTGMPGDGNFPALSASAPAERTTELDLGLQRLQEAYLALDALRAADKAQGSVEKTAMDLLK